MKTQTHILNVFQKLNPFSKIKVVFNRDREDLRILNELVLLENQVEEVRFQDDLGKHNYHIKTEKLFQQVTDTMKNTAEILTNL